MPRHHTSVYPVLVGYCHPKKGVQVDSASLDPAQTPNVPKPLELPMEPISSKTVGDWA